MKKKLLISVPAAIMLLALYFMIFRFSGQDGEQSGSLSRLISEKCVEFINSISGKRWNDVMMEQLAAYFEHPIRKLAHFTEYCIMACLLYVIFYQWVELKLKYYLIIVIWVFLSAAADEFHQSFVPGRYASIADVFLDTSGGCFGLLLSRIFCKLMLRKIYNQKIRRDIE